MSSRHKTHLVDRDSDEDAAVFSDNEKATPIEYDYRTNAQSSSYSNYEVDDFDFLSRLNLASFTKSSIQNLLNFAYQITPFLLLFHFIRVYLQPIPETFYYPDLPNAFQLASVEELNDLNVEFYDLKDYASTSTGWQNNERILFLVPLRDASPHLPMFFSHMRNLTYPHHLIDLAFLISDTTDSTVPDLKRNLREFQKDPALAFGRIEIFEKDFGQIVGQSFSDRHGFAAQGPRRKKMAIARNWLLTIALRPEHAWVYWRDIDVETCPGTVLEDLMHHDKDVIVPNIWRPLPDWLGYEQAYDLNSWQESEGGIELAERLDEDAVIVEGYPEYATWRPHLAYLRDPNGDPEVEIDLDGIGGVSILAKGHVFRRGAMFPAFSFKKHAETEAFGKLCKTMGFQVVGLPHYVLWHIYEPSSDDLKHMEWLANEEIRHQEHLKNKVVYDKAWKSAFEDVSEKWEQEKFDVFKNTDLSKLNLGSVHWDEVDEYLTADYDEEDEDGVWSVDSDKKDNQFLLNFDQEGNKKLEKDVLQKLSSRPERYGSSRHEIVFSGFNGYGSASKNKKMKFKKFVVENVDTDEDGLALGKLSEQSSNAESKYDVNSEKVVSRNKQTSSSTSSKKNAGSAVQDKQLFDDLENNKAVNDGEEEGGVEFKDQISIEEASELKQKAKQGTFKTKTYYEIDEEGATVGTVYKTVAVKPTAAPKPKSKKKVRLVEVVDDEEETEYEEELVN
ncbi:hypothetical protein WICPIJ_004260 [Wickerhamomyces pijperi]|uniref:Mannan polymerase II complex ANP1 subunit n=1 Tax=Wickerhamomyces pijperi TaxID=599730 RepID=A0A9P8TMZ3_WICPI|nr:hypothetical protein WICPIJ_004260 [Wickerhamomyces pijperi]